MYPLCFSWSSKVLSVVYISSIIVQQCGKKVPNTAGNTQRRKQEELKQIWTPRFLDLFLTWFCNITKYKEMLTVAFLQGLWTMSNNMPETLRPLRESTNQNDWTIWTLRDPKTVRKKIARVATQNARCTYCN